MAYLEPDQLARQLADRAAADGQTLYAVRCIHQTWIGGYWSGAGLGEALSLGLATLLTCCGLEAEPLQASRRDIIPSFVEPERTSRGLKMSVEGEYERSRPFLFSIS